MNRKDLGDLFFTDFDGDRVKVIHVTTNENDELVLVVSNKKMAEHGIALQHTVSSTEIEWDYSK